jgi:peptidylprolyl isomerase
MLKRPLPLSGALLAMLAAFAVSGCGDDDPTGPTGPVDPEDLDFAPALGVDLTQMTKTPEGLYYQDLQEGAGSGAVDGDDLVVHYTVWLHDGTKIDSSLDFGQPFDFTLGIGEVIPGWDIGLQGLKQGGQRKLVIPSNLAYGSRGSGPIPPYATLVFDVELVELNRIPSIR